VSGRNPERARELANFYLAEAEIVFVELKNAIATHTASEVERLAHKCGGASSTCGMTSILPLLNQLERLGREQQLADAAEVFKQAEVELLRIRVFIDASLGAPPRTP
jgi:HPt (histidine-containing phosphotransfer) domain-containing protein